MPNLTNLSATASRLAVATLLFALFSPALAGEVETLGYEVVYRGVFSLGRDMPIADMTLATERSTVVPGLLRTRMHATSAPYNLVESTYPMRYRFRSWTEEASGHLIGLETYEKTRREKHRLYLRDESVRGVRRLKPVSDRFGDAIHQLETGSIEIGRYTRPLFDRLGLLQQIRRLDLRPLAEFTFTVTNGKELMDYRVRVGGTTTLCLGGREVSAWKLRLDADERDDRGRVVPAHRPVYIWLGRDRSRTPLRADVRHAIGHFRVQLTSPIRAVQLASRHP